MFHFLHKYSQYLNNPHVHFRSGTFMESKATGTYGGKRVN